MWYRFLNDTSGGIAASETVLIGSILVLGMVVALVELQCSMIAEINDIADAGGQVSQSFDQSGMQSSKSAGLNKARTVGASYDDHQDSGDTDDSVSLICNDPGEIRK